MQVEEYIPVEEKKKKKTKGGEVEGEGGEDVWSQEQQKALEAALTQFPKVQYRQILSTMHLFLLTIILIFSANIANRISQF